MIEGILNLLVTVDNKPNAFCLTICNKPLSDCKYLVILRVSVSALPIGILLLP